MGDDEWNSDEDRLYAAATTSAQQTNAPRQDTRRPNNDRFVTNNHSKKSFTRTDWRSKEEQEKIEVRSTLVGKIIGRGGSKIRELEAQSQARINVQKCFENPDTSIVSLSGSPQARAKAKELIEMLVQEEPPPAAFVNYADPNKYAPEEPEVCDEPVSEPIDWAARYLESKKAQEAYWATLPPILKDFYNEDPEIAGMSDEDVAMWREQNYNITVRRILDEDSSETVESLSKIPNPVHEFHQAFSGYPEIMEVIRKQEFTKPTPIQGQAWPVLLSGQDLIGIAQTGTGKTLAFLLPALIHIDNQPTPVPDREGPNVLVLAPTRELAIQIEREVNKYQYKDYRAVCIYGGASRRDQINIVEKGVQIVIATPGRLNDLVNAGHLNVEAITYLVLDEADRMLDMGFGPQIKVFLLKIRPNRQTVMTSATWPNDVQRLAMGYMKNPIQVVVGSLDLAAVHSVSQEIIFVEDEFKFKLLVEHLKNMQSDDKVIVFCGRRATTVHVSSDLALLGYNYQAIYGGLDQSERVQALEDMRTGEVNILIATDIASRGIDINNITHIINYDFPRDLEEFVHRVGRTGRAGRSGQAITFFTRNDWAKAEGLIAILREANQEVPHELVQMAERYRKKRENPDFGSRRGGRGGGRGNFHRETKYY